MEDLLSVRELELTLVEDTCPTGSGHERDFLPPPRLRPKREPEPTREPESRVSKVAKLAGLTTAASLLIGAVVASSMLTRQRPADTRDPNPAPPQITGAAALGAFLPGTGTAEAPHAQSHPMRPQPSVTATSQAPVAQTQPIGTAPAPTTSSSIPTTTTTEVTDGQKVAVVKQFYQRMVSSHPEDALAMLSPELAGDEPGDLVRAWSSMSEVHVDEVQVQPDGAVRAVVTMVQQDGVRLRVTQVLGLAKDKGPVISQAELLSAEQL
ncbi:hypothetical protein [Amycolatopsis pithecellobii]|uniref:Uncharacterized protein n=1 Tax=Amycolatopsis pithecellobii TaxID=664692 RepID=A0A6N7YTE3_9PSEU|nr:hypothetical protein [Amycolatopsis pithecellobii]MTD56295.1 hypothetical protein [Amycolatopsis pithecellobii]